MSGTDQEPIVLERVDDLVLRAAGPHHEIISNGVFLMDTRNGESERLLVRAALDLLPMPEPSVLIGGLGVGFTLREATRTPDTGPITVVELEPAIIAWHATHLRHHTAGALADPRVHLVQADLLTYLADPAAPGTYDAICLDIDNGPDWTVTDTNQTLYTPEGLDLIQPRLTPDGVLSVWSAAPSPTYEDLLRQRFKTVQIRTIPVPRGDPDLLYLAHNV